MATACGSRYGTGYGSSVGVRHARHKTNLAKDLRDPWRAATSRPVAAASLTFRTSNKHFIGLHVKHIVDIDNPTSTVQSGKTGPAPGRSELPKGILR